MGVLTYAVCDARSHPDRQFSKLVLKPAAPSASPHGVVCGEALQRIGRDPPAILHDQRRTNRRAVPGAAPGELTLCSVILIVYGCSCRTATELRVAPA